MLDLYVVAVGESREKRSGDGGGRGGVQGSFRLARGGKAKFFL